MAFYSRAEYGQIICLLMEAARVSPLRPDYLSFNGSREGSTVRTARFSSAASFLAQNLNPKKNPNLYQYKLGLSGGRERSTARLFVF